MYGYSVVCFYLGVMMGRLGAPFAVFGTMSRTGIDDRASIERFITDFFTDFVVLMLSISYIPLRNIFFSLLTVTLSSAVIELLQKSRQKTSAED